MPIIINPGSENKGGTFEQALKIAGHWLRTINEIFPEVTMTTKEDRFQEGDWKFIFTHGVTGKSIELHTHGFTDEECEKFIFNPRIYWNGSSTSECEPENWLAEGYKYRIVYEKTKN